MGRIDEDGFVVLLDRKKDMIISGGFNVYAADIEVMMLRHPDVIDVAVIGIPSEQWGESPMALCVRRAGAHGCRRTRSATGRTASSARPNAWSRWNSAIRCRAAPSARSMKRELREPYWAGRTARI